VSGPTVSSSSTTEPATCVAISGKALVRRLHVDEMDVHPVDLGRELRQAFSRSHRRRS
jgi:hypothetical protein